MDERGAKVCDNQIGIMSHSVLSFNEAGLQMLWADAKKARRIKTNMWKHNIKFHQLPYREMEHLRQVRMHQGQIPEVHGEIIKVNPVISSFFFPIFFTTDQAVAPCQKSRSFGKISSFVTTALPHHPHPHPHPPSTAP